MKKFDDGDFSESYQSKQIHKNGQSKGLTSELNEKRDQRQLDSQQLRRGTVKNDRTPKFTGGQSQNMSLNFEKQANRGLI